MSGAPRTHRRNACRAGVLLALAIVLASTAHAQEFSVYEWEQPYEGWLEPAYWTTWFANSDRAWQHFGDSVRMQGAVRHTAEVGYGITDNLATELYLDGETAPGEGFHLIQTKGVLRYHFFQRYVRYFNPAIYVEYYVPRKRYQAAQRVEARLILDHDFNDVRLALNPSIERRMSTDSVRGGVFGAFSGSMYWRRHYAVQPGVEYYTEFEQLGASPRAGALDQRIFAAANIRFAERFVWNIGVGYGLTNAADRVTVKSIFSYEFPTASPANVRR